MDKEHSKEELIPYNYLKRSDDQAYDGILGFSGEYYESDKLQGDVILSRQDLMLDLHLLLIHNYVLINSCLPGGHRNLKRRNQEDIF